MISRNTLNYKCRRTFIRFDRAPIQNGSTFSIRGTTNIVRTVVFYSCDLRLRIRDPASTTIRFAKMPRNKTSRIQKIARQADVTFKNFDASALGDDKVFLNNQSELITLLTEIRAADLKIAPRQEQGKDTKTDPSPPVTYMHICESDSVSIGVFQLKSGATIPLHDHPGMNGMLKVLYGKVRILCFDELDKPPDFGNDAQFDPPLSAFPNDALRRAILRSTSEYTEDSAPCILAPKKHNLHQIDAMEGPAAFIDILAPPYDPDNGRDCHYYKVLQTVAGTDKTLEEHEEENQGETWLLEIPQPEDFWCGGEPYRGPKVSI